MYSMYSDYLRIIFSSITVYLFIIIAIRLFGKKEDGLLEQMNRMVANVIAPTNDDGEINHPRLVNGRVVGPPTWKEVYKYCQQQGWATSNFDENASGTMP